MSHPIPNKSEGIKCPVHLSDKNYLCGADGGLICRLVEATDAEMREIVEALNTPPVSVELNTAVLKRTLGSMLRTNDIKPKSATGRKMILAFWYGAITQSGREAPAGVAICLLIGRHEELVDMGAGDV